MDEKDIRRKQRFRNFDKAFRRLEAGVIMQKYGYNPGNHVKAHMNAAC